VSVEDHRGELAATVLVRALGRELPEKGTAEFTGEVDLPALCLPVLPLRPVLPLPVLAPSVLRHCAPAPRTAPHIRRTCSSSSGLSWSSDSSLISDSNRCWSSSP